MSAEEQRQVDRELARGLCAALEPIMAGRRDPLALDAARHVAQLLVLPGLDRLLAALGAHPGAAAPVEMRHAIDRLRRERDRALAQSSLVAFYESDRELAALASHLEGLEWTAAPQAGEPGAAPSAPREAVIGLMQALGGARYASEASEAVAARVRLSAPVAAVLRAALDWLCGASEQRGPLRVSEDAGTVEVECRGVDPGGLLPAHEVIASVGGCLGPAQGGGGGAWTLRLPAVTDHEWFLMLQQDALHLALPWANVLRIQLETPEGEPLGVPPLAPLTPLTGARRGRPVVTVGLGLRRGSLAVDRLVWRLAAEPAQTDLPAPEGTTRAVRCDDGETFWVIDVAKLMRDVPLPPLPEPRAAAAAEDESAPGATPPVPARAAAAAEDVPAPAAESPQPAPPASAPAPAPAPAAGVPSVPRGGEPARVSRLILLRPEQVEALEHVSAAGPAVDIAAPPEPAAPPLPARPREPARVQEPAPAPMPQARADSAARHPAAAGTQAQPAGAPAPGHARRALVAEDSFMARIFLMRLLQRQGYNVHAVGTAQELRGALAGETWALVCVDVELPDARGAALIREVSESQLELAEPAVVIALVRDWADQQQAAMGGVHRVLLKPFSQREIARMLERAGLPATGSR